MEKRKSRIFQSIKETNRKEMENCGEHTRAHQILINLESFCFVFGATYAKHIEFAYKLPNGFNDFRCIIFFYTSSSAPFISFVRFSFSSKCDTVPIL